MRPEASRGEYVPFGPMNKIVADRASEIDQG